MFNDNAVLTVEVLPKNPNILEPGRFNDVMIERYEVRYFRTDGRNAEGVDVPFRFTGGLGTLIPVEQRRRRRVRRRTAHRQAGAAAQEPERSSTAPAAAEASTSSHVIAEITIHGRTTSGEVVRAAARLNITFADFADDTTNASSTVPGSTTATTVPSGQSGF